MTDVPRPFLLAYDNARSQRARARIPRDAIAHGVLQGRCEGVLLAFHYWMGCDDASDELLHAAYVEWLKTR